MKIYVQISSNTVPPFEYAEIGTFTGADGETYFYTTGKTR